MNPEDIEFPSVTMSEILAEMDELGRSKFDAALAQARLRKAMERIAAFEQQGAPK